MSVEGDVEALYKAMKGLGTDDATLIAILTGRKRKHLQAVKTVFEQKYGKTLEHWVKGETSGHYEDLLLAIIEERTVYNAKLVYSAVKGLGTNEDILIEVLCTKSNKEIRAIADAFKRLYGKDMAKEVHDDLSGDLRKLFDEVMKAQRDESTQDKELAKQEAKLLYDRGEGRLGTDENTFIHILTSKSWGQIQLINFAYADISGHSLEEAIKKETSGYFQKALIALQRTPLEFWAHHFHDSIKGIGTKDSALVRGVGAHNKKQLRQINIVYTKKFGHTLVEDVKDDTSGDFRKTLLSIIPTNLN